MKKPFIILDRDSVINYESEDYIKSPEEWIAIPKSLEAIARLNQAGFHVLIVTNQSGVGRGYYDLATLDRIHEKLVAELASVGGHIEEIFYCPHLPQDGCECRKPAPGLFNEIKAKYPIDLSETFYIGDNWSDVKVAQTVGCQPLLVLTGKGEQTLAAYPEYAAIPHFSDLAEAVEYIL